MESNSNSNLEGEPQVWEAALGFLPKLADSEAVYSQRDALEDKKSPLEFIFGPIADHLLSRRASCGSIRKGAKWRSRRLALRCGTPATAQGTRPKIMRRTLRRHGSPNSSQARARVGR